MHKLPAAALLLLLLLVCTSQHAQSVVPSIQRETVTEKGIYRFPAFTEGTLVFRNGIMSSGKLNYNISLDEMHFISQNGDTLSVAEPVSLSFINLNGSRFYYDKGYIQTLDTAAGLILGFRQGLTAQQERKEAYGATKAHEGVRTYTFFTGNGREYHLGGDETVKVSSKEYFFFGDAFGHFSKAGRDALYTHFDKHQAAIKDFLKTHHTNFNRLDDLQELMQFLRGLQ